MKWTDVKNKIDFIDDHYSMREDQHELLFKYAMKVPKGGTVLELGTAHGKTAALFCLVGKERGFDYYGIDDFSLEGDSTEVRNSLDSLNLDYTLIESRTQEAAWDKPVDLLFIDAGHDEANVKPDCEKYVPFVKPGGIVIFDDWAEDDTHVNPHWAVGHYGKIATQGWEDIIDDIYIRGFRRPA